MTIKELIKELGKYGPNLPVCIDDYMGFAEAYEESIETELRIYMLSLYRK